MSIQETAAVFGAEAERADALLAPDGTDCRQIGMILLQLVEDRCLGREPGLPKRDQSYLGTRRKGLSTGGDIGADLTGAQAAERLSILMPWLRGGNRSAGLVLVIVTPGVVSSGDP